MATGYTQAELDALLDAMDSLAPPIPTERDRAQAGRVAAMRAAGTEKGILVDIEIKQGETGHFWFNCWVAKEMAAEINFVSQSYAWSKRRIKPRSSKRLAAPTTVDIKAAAQVLSLSTYGVPGGILMRFAIGRPPQDKAVFFPVNAALEISSYIATAATQAAWWDDDFELIPSRESQH